MLSKAEHKKLHRGPLTLVITDERMFCGLSGSEAAQLSAAWTVILSSYLCFCQFTTFQCGTGCYFETLVFVKTS